MTKSLASDTTKCKECKEKDKKLLIEALKLYKAGDKKLVEVLKDKA